MSTPTAGRSGNKTLGDFKSEPEPDLPQPKAAKPAKPMSRPFHAAAKPPTAPRAGGRLPNLRRTAAEATGLVDPNASATTPFQLSRIYSKGWLAGMDDRIDDVSACTDGRAEALNPCKPPAERERWAQGFAAAVKRKFASPGQTRLAFRADGGR